MWCAACQQSVYGVARACLAAQCCTVLHNALDCPTVTNPSKAAPGALHAPVVGAPVFEPKCAKLLQYVEALCGGDVPVALLLDLSKQPGCGYGGEA